VWHRAKARKWLRSFPANAGVRTTCGLSFFLGEPMPNQRPPVKQPAGVPAPAVPRLLRAPEAARYPDLTYRQFWGLMGRIPCRRTGRGWRWYRRVDLDQWIGAWEGQPDEATSLADCPSENYWEIAGIVYPSFKMNP